MKTMKKLFSILAVLLLIGLCLSAPVLAEDIRGTELQIVVAEPTPTVSPTPTASPSPGTPDGPGNPGTGLSPTTGVMAGAAAAVLVLAVALGRAQRKKKPAKQDQ